MNATATANQPTTEVTNVVPTIQDINKAFNESCLLATKHDSEMGAVRFAQFEMGAVAVNAIEAYMKQFNVDRWSAIVSVSESNAISANGLFAFMAVGMFGKGDKALEVHPQQLITLLANVSADDRKATWTSIARGTMAEAVGKLTSAVTPKADPTPKTDAQLGTSSFNSAIKHHSKWTPAQRAEVLAILSA